MQTGIAYTDSYPHSYKVSQSGVDVTLRKNEWAAASQ